MLLWIRSRNTYKGDERKKYFMNVLDNHPYIVVYHVAGPSNLKNCSDVDHFHMLTWHPMHPTSEHSFNMLKRLMEEREEKGYVINYQKVYNPYGLVTYLSQDEETRYVEAVGNLQTDGQQTLLRKLTPKKIVDE